MVTMVRNPFILTPLGELLFGFKDTRYKNRLGSFKTQPMGFPFVCSESCFHTIRFDTIRYVRYTEDPPFFTQRVPLRNSS